MCADIRFGMRCEQDLKTSSPYDSVSGGSAGGASFQALGGELWARSHQGTSVRRLEARRSKVTSTSSLRWRKPYSQVLDTDWRRVQGCLTLSSCDSENRMSAESGSEEEDLPSTSPGPFGEVKLPIIELSSNHLLELQRRIDHFEHHSDDVIDWEDCKAAILAARTSSR